MICSFVCRLYVIAANNSCNFFVQSERVSAKLLFGDIRVPRQIEVVFAGNFVRV